MVEGNIIENYGVGGAGCTTGAGMIGTPKYLVGFLCRTCGSDQENLGSDEAEILVVCWVVVETTSGKLISIHPSLVQPDNLSKVSWELLEQRGISEEEVKSSLSLAETLKKYDVYGLLPPSLDGETNSFALVTEGPLTLRQVLHPECFKKGIPLPHYYSVYFDIRREYTKFYNNNNEKFTTFDECLQYNNITANASDVYGVNVASDLGCAISKLVKDAKLKGLSCFTEPEAVQATLDYGLWKTDDYVDSMLVVRARGLPWQCTDHDVANFFKGLNISKGGVALCLSSTGRRNGEALVRFDSVEHRDMALRRHRHFMGNRYIEVYRGLGEDFVRVASGNNEEAQEFLSRGAAVIVRMRGLPYDATPEQIIQFFQKDSVAPTVEIMGGEDGILFVNKPDGRATGDAFVLFGTEEDASKALARHKDVIGQRYIELFRSTVAEVQQIITRSMESGQRQAEANGKIPTTPEILQFLNAANMQMSLPTAAAPALPQNLVISGALKDCIRLRGLPYEAHVQHILDFLGEHSKQIVFQGVHMVYNAQGQPSGEAFIQMTTEYAAQAAALERHNKYMQITKKQRYIEVFQCSADDMNLVLTGPSIPNAANTAVLPGTLSPQGVRPIISAANGISPGSAGFFGLSGGTGTSHQIIPSQLTVATPPTLAFGTSLPPNGMSPVPVTFASPMALPAHHLHTAPTRIPVIPTAGGFMPATAAGATFLYWPYPSPPVSPGSFYAAQQNAAVITAAQQANLGGGPSIIMMRNVPSNASTTDVLAFFSGYEVTPECVQFQRAHGRFVGDVLVTFGTRNEAERAIMEKNKQTIYGSLIDLFMLGV